MKITKYETGYKVVRKRSLISCTVIGKNIAVRYKINEWVKPIKDCGPFCVFNTIEDAERFNHQMLASIYECLYERSSDRYVYIQIPYTAPEARPLLDLPTGTVLATKVKLIRGIR